MTPRGIAFGEALIDCFPDREVVAGAPLHVACHLARLGWSSALVTRLGADGDGARVRAVLAEHDVDDGLVETDPALPTGRVTIAMRDGDHGFTIHSPAAWDAIEGPGETPRCDAFVYGSLAARDARSGATLRRLLAGDGWRFFDVNLRPPDVPLDFIREGLAAAHVLKLNGDEAERLGDALGCGAAPDGWFAAAERLRYVCCTRGRDGAELTARDGRSWSLPAADVEIVDTVGAGDAFTSGLVDGLVRGRPPARTLAQAHTLATAIVQQRGGLPQPNAGS